MRTLYTKVGDAVIKIYVTTKWYIYGSVTPQGRHNEVLSVLYK